MQLSLFPIPFPAINVLPSLGVTIELSVAPMWCDECYEATTWLPLSDPSEGWHCEHSSECQTCFNAQHSLCNNCENCDECCSCSYCESCSEMVDNVCETCEHCDHCCDCEHCGFCGRQYRSGSYSICSECERCERCGCECEEEEEEEEETDNGCSCSQCRPSQSDVVPNGTGRHLFGIEIEFVGSRSEVGRALLPFPGWKVIPDGSVSGGGEVVSPVLDWDDDNAREQLADVVKAMRSAGAETSSRAGIHVHIDARDLTHSQVSRVAVWGHEWSDQLIRLASSGWRSIRSEGIGNYCRPITADMARSLENVTDEESFAVAYYGRSDLTYIRSDHYNFNRYRAINLHSWVYRGTVEFRVFNSSLNAARIMAYISLCVAVVQSSRDGKTPKPAVAFALGAMARGEVTGDEAFAALVDSLSNYLTPTDRLRLAWVWRESHPQMAAA